MSETTITKPPRDMVAQLRAVAPLRPLTMGDAYTVAERQATTALRLAGITAPHVSLSWIFDLPRTEVRLEPRYVMNGLSGSTTFSKGRYVIVINKNDAHARRRFTFAHEWKHLLDYTANNVLYRHLGHGDTHQQERKVERIADHFAACLLMPRMWVKNAWTGGIQDIPALAGLFMVSEDAMRVRLTYLGLLDDDQRPVRTYFRRVASLDLCPAT
ncbi:MAG: ImmA/IrrE family metallo-endopeptidase [Pseudonocardiaceae bacterium]